MGQRTGFVGSATLRWQDLLRMQLSSSASPSTCERLCDRCGGATRKRVYMHFMFRKGWHCQFLEEDMKTQLPHTLTFADDRKIWEMAKRGGFTLNIAGRQELEAALSKGVGGIWLDLTREQYAKLRSADAAKR